MSVSIKILIHYGGSMSKEDDGDYKYIGQLGCESVQWKASEITWEKFESFLRDFHVRTAIALIWYKEVAQDMKNLNYVFESTNGDMGALLSVGEVAGEIHVFIEHECSKYIPDVVHLLPSSQSEDQGAGGVNEREYDYDDGNEADEDIDDNEAESENDDDDERPREDVEGERSEDEAPPEENENENEEQEVVDEGGQNEVDDGDDVVIDAGDGANDERFNTLFEEGAKNQKENCLDDEENAEEVREAAESDEDYKGPFEDLQNKGKATRHGRTQHCSRCGQAGHIKSGCKNEAVVVEGPKNRRGRPRKNPEEVMPKRPTQPKKKRKTSSDVSNSQPIQEGELSTPIPAASSAPQPSVSSDKTKPPLKKKRGRPLKITKPGDITRGTAKLMSPFTDRLFDVFKDTAGQSKPPQ